MHSAHCWIFLLTASGVFSSDVGGLLNSPVAIPAIERNCGGAKRVSNTGQARARRGIEQRRSRCGTISVQEVFYAKLLQELRKFNCGGRPILFRLRNRNDGPEPRALSPRYAAYFNSAARRANDCRSLPGFSQPIQLGCCLDPRDCSAYGCFWRRSRCGRLSRPLDRDARRAVGFAAGAVLHAQ